MDNNKTIKEALNLACDKLAYDGCPCGKDNADEYFNCDERCRPHGGIDFTRECWKLFFIKRAEIMLGLK